MGLGDFLKKAVGVVAPVLGAATGNPVLGAIGTGIGGMLATEDQQDFATSSAQQANAFTKEQLQNRHQWEVDDLRKAGLNPILSAMKGAPSIGGSAQAVSSGNIAENTAALTSSGAQSAQQRLNLKKLDAEIDLLRSNAEASKTQGVKNLAEARSTGNLANWNQLKGDFASSFHGLTKSSSKAVSDVIERVKSGKPIQRDWSDFPKNATRQQYLQYMEKKGY